MRILLKIIILFFVFLLSAYTQSIKMISVDGTSIEGKENETFIIEIEVGNPTAVEDLVGASFNLTWDNASLVEGINTTAGTFVGSNPLVLGQNFDGRIEVGVTSTSGGKNGSGIVARCELRIKEDINTNTALSFNLTNIEAIDGNGGAIVLNPENNPYMITLTSVVGISEDSKITEFKLNQNYPNPFNPSTTINFAVPIRADVKLTIFTILGEVVEILHNSFVDEGNYAISFDSVNRLSSGIYFYQIVAKGIDGKKFNQIKKMMLIK